MPFECSAGRSKNVRPPSTPAHPSSASTTCRFSSSGRVTMTAVVPRESNSRKTRLSRTYERGKSAQSMENEPVELSSSGTSRTPSRARRRRSIRSPRSRRRRGWRRFSSSLIEMLDANGLTILDRRNPSHRHGSNCANFHEPWVRTGALSCDWQSAENRGDGEAS